MSFSVPSRCSDCSLPNRRMIVYPIGIFFQCHLPFLAVATETRDSKEGTACKLLKSLRLARRRLSTFQHLPKCRQSIRSRPRGLNSVRVSIRYSFTTGVSFRWGNGFLRVKTHYRCKMSVAQPVKIPALNCRSAIWKSDAENERTLSGGQLGFAILGLMLTLLPNR